jgi:hypothetical protein
MHGFSLRAMRLFLTSIFFVLPQRLGDLRFAGPV